MSHYKVVVAYRMADADDKQLEIVPNGWTLAAVTEPATVDGLAMAPTITSVTSSVFAVQPATPTWGLDTPAAPDDELVEAAAKALSRYTPDQWERWHWLPDGVRFKEDARRALAAVWPLLVADREARDRQAKLDVLDEADRVLAEIAQRPGDRAKGLVFALGVARNALTKPAPSAMKCTGESITTWPVV